MTTLRRQATIGTGGRFLTLEDAIAFYAQFNMRLTSHQDGCAEFAANVVVTQAESWDGRSFHEVYTANMKRDTKARTDAAKRGGEAKKRHYRQENCAVCGGERDLGLKRALCRSCYNAQKNAQYAAKKKGRAA